MTDAADPRTAAFIRRVQWGLLALGGVGLAACVIGAIFNPARFFPAYLMGYLFCCEIALGCLGILMLNHLTGGAWGLVPRRLMEAAARTLPLLLLLFVPIAIGIPWLYPWARPDEVARSPLLQYKRLYLNVPFFLIRTAIYFAVWITLAYLLSSWSRRQQTEDPVPLWRRMRVLSGPGLVIYGLTSSFAYIDWVMTLRPEWYSTIFGLIVVVGQALSAYAFVIVVLAMLGRHEPMSSALSPKVLHDLGKLLLAFVMLWAYMSFCQLLITWAGNLPREVTWYVPRLRGGWQWLGLLLIVGHFAVPFILLLSRERKRHLSSLAAVAWFILAMRVVHEFWLTAPDFHPQGFVLHWMDIVAPIGLGGVWGAYFAWQLRRGPLLPLGAPYLDVALEKRR